MKQRIRYSKRNVLSLLLALCMLVTMIPQMAFAGESDPSISWSTASAEGKAGVKGTLTVNTTNLSDINADDFTVISSNNAVIPEDYIKIVVSGSDLKISYFPIQTGTATLNVKNTEETLMSDDITITVAEQNVTIIDGKYKALPNPNSSLNYIPFAYNAEITYSSLGDTSVIEINNSKVYGVKPGTAKVHFTSDDNDNVDFYWNYIVTEPTYKWENANTTVYVGGLSQSVLQTDGIPLQPEDFAFKSDNEGIIPNKYIEASQYVNYLKLSYFPIRTGECNIYVTSNKYPDKVIDTLHVTVSDRKEISVYEGSTANLLNNIPFNYSVVIEDPSVVELSENGVITGKKEGFTNIYVISEAEPDLKINYPVRVKAIPESGLIYDKKVCKQLSWNVKELGSDILIDWQKWAGTYLISSSSYNAIIIDSSNTDVIEPDYTSGFTTHRVENPLKLVAKNNGTATVYLYTAEKRTEEQFIGACIITVTDADKDSGSGWESCDNPQGLSGKIQLLDYPVETNSFNNSKIENNIAQTIKVSDAQFRLQITGNVTDPGNATDEQKSVYEENILKRINICEVNEDGSVGEVVASASNGYQAKFAYNNETSNSCTTVTVNVDKDVLKKGKTYLLTGEPDLIASVGYGYKYYAGNKVASKYHFPVGLKSQWTFTTIGGASSIILDKSNATLAVGNSLTLAATMNEDADDSVVWSSSDPAVAKVDQNGKVTAVKAGTVKITAAAADGTGKAVCTVTVSPVKVTKVKVSATKLTLTAGQKKALKATVYPSNATNKAVTWSTSNKKVAKVDSKGNVTAVAAGKATITVKTKDGSFKAKTTVTVKPKNTTFKLTGKKNAITIKYKKIKGVSGYQIYRAKSKNGKYKKVTTRPQRYPDAYTSIRLQSGKTYYYKIRTYKVVDGKRIYSSFSVPKKVKTK